jgi:hypothetical protein
MEKKDDIERESQCLSFYQGHSQSQRKLLLANYLSGPLSLYLFNSHPLSTLAIKV